MSWIVNERKAREAQQAAQAAPQWTGEAWRDHRASFKAWFYAQAVAQGVPMRLASK